VRRLLVAVVGLVLILAVPATPARADNVRDAEWFLASLNMARAWQISQGDGVTVAVIDSGINSNQPDLAGNVLPGISLVPGHPGNGLEDIDEHGTSMAALIAAHGHGDAGVLGVAPRAKIVPVQVDFGANHGGPDLVATGVNEAVARGARVISISLGDPGGSVALHAAIEQARQADVVVVASMGNTDQDTRVVCPACYDGVVAVGGTDRSGQHATISIAGPQMVVSAPAVDIETAGRNNSYGMGTGTSGSAAITAGVVALIRSKYPKMSAVDVIHRLTATATDKGPKGRDDQYGYGIVNPYAALTADIPSVDPTASSSTAGTPTPSAPPTAKGSKSASIAVLVLIVAVAVLAMMWIRRAAARYRRRIHDD
jgi:type VII secretion-associated serine protease mycosin